MIFYLLVANHCAILHLNNSSLASPQRT